MTPRFSLSNCQDGASVSKDETWEEQVSEDGQTPRGGVECETPVNPPSGDIEGQLHPESGALRRSELVTGLRA